MRNEKGITLVELLAALAIIGIITAVISSVLLTGTSSADRTTSKQRLQQEANYIVEAIRSEYLEEETSKILIIVTQNSIVMEREGKADKLLANSFEYELKTENEISPKKNQEFQLILKDNNEVFKIQTTFSKIR